MSYVQGGTNESSYGEEKVEMQPFRSQKLRRPLLSLSWPRPITPSSLTGRGFSAGVRPGIPLSEKVGIAVSAGVRFGAAKSAANAAAAARRPTTRCMVAQAVSTTQTAAPPISGRISELAPNRQVCGLDDDGSRMLGGAPSAPTVNGKVSGMDSTLLI